VAWSISFRTRWFASLALLLTSWASAAIAAESRCTELGVNCTCSEPLNTQSWTSGGGGFVNPGDSTTLQCGGGSPWYPDSKLVVVPETGMPAGNQVNYVWRYNYGSGMAVFLGNKQPKPTTKRMCTRYYLRLSSNYFDNGCDGGKYIDFQPGKPTYQLQLGSGGYVGPFNLAQWWPPTGATNAPRSGTLQTTDCAGQWCRMEECISGDFAGGTGTFYSEARVVRISDGLSVQFPRDELGTTAPGSWGEVWIADNFRGNDEFTCHPSTNRPNPAAWRDNSYAMQAEWAVDQPGVFIGPAYEVEGGNAAPLPSPSPSPSPAAPPPPVLLP